MKIKAIYGLIAGVILISWIGNFSYSQYYKLPNPGFLRHYVEIEAIPFSPIELLYVANNDDERKPVNVQIAELPELRFDPLQVHQELRRQTIYVLRGYIQEDAMTERTAKEPLRLRTATVYYNDGSARDEEIGEIVVYREAWPLDTSVDSPITMMSSGNSSSNEGFSTVKAERPVRLEGVTSILLDRLGAAFQYEIETDSSGSELGEGQSVKLSYRFRLSQEDRMNVYSLLLRETFVEPNGKKSSTTKIANYLPYPSESEMRAYVREERRGGE